MRPILRFWRDFLIGDDWSIALGVVAALAVTALAGAAAWWLLPVAVVVLLGWSLWRAARRT